MHLLDFSYFLRNWGLGPLCTAPALSTVFTAVRPSWMCSLAKLRDCCSHRHRLCCHFWTHWGCFVAKFIAFACFYQLRPLDQNVTFVKILIRMNVRIHSYQQNYTNEYPNIFVLIFLIRTNV